MKYSLSFIMVFKTKHYLGLQRRMCSPKLELFRHLGQGGSLRHIDAAFHLLSCVSPYFSVTEKQVESGYMKTLGSQ